MIFSTTISHLCTLLERWDAGVPLETSALLRRGVYLNTLRSRPQGRVVVH